MAISRGRDGAFSDKDTPSIGQEVKYIGVLQVLQAVMATMQDHRVAMHDAGSSVAAAGRIATVLHLCEL